MYLRVFESMVVPPILSSFFALIAICCLPCLARFSLSVKSDCPEEELSRAMQY